MLVLDLAVAMVAFADLATLAGAGRLRVERHVGQVCSLDEPQDVELVIENPGRVARSMRLRDDVPDEFSAEPGRVRRQRAGPAPGHSLLPLRAQEAGHIRFRAGRRPGCQPAGFLAGTILAGRCGPRCESIPTFTRSRGSRCWRGATGCRPMGVRRSRRLGTDNEFERLRDYIEGDDPRHIDWRASARRQQADVAGRFSSTRASGSSS